MIKLKISSMNVIICCISLIVLCYIYFYNTNYISEKKILLIINFAWHKYENTHFLNNVYIPFFRKYFKFKCDVIYFGPKKSTMYNINSYNLPENGFYSYKSLIMAYEQNKHYYGYLYINDDGFLNPFLINIYNFTKIIIESIHYINTTNNIWPFIKRKNEYNISYYTSLNVVVRQICMNKKYISSKLCKAYNPPYIIGGWSDFFYIPSSNIKEVVCLMKIFLQNLVFLESTITTISQLFDYEVLWKKCNLNKLYFLYTCPYVHPVKYSIETNKKIITTLINHYSSQHDWYSTDSCYLCDVSSTEYLIAKNQIQILNLKENKKIINNINK